MKFPSAALCIRKFLINIFFRQMVLSCLSRNCIISERFSQSSRLASKLFAHQATLDQMKHLNKINQSENSPHFIERRANFLPTQSKRIEKVFSSLGWKSLCELFFAASPFSSQARGRGKKVSDQN